MIDWFHLFAVQGTLKTSQAPQFESINSSMLSLLYGPTLTCVHDYWKNHNSDYTDLFSKLMSLFFNALSQLATASLLRSKCHNFMAAVTIHSDFVVKKKKKKSTPLSTFFCFICHEGMGLNAMILVFWMWVSSQLFHFPLSCSSRSSLVPLHFLPCK